MIDNLAFDRALGAALRDGPDAAPVRVIDGAIANAIGQRQRRPRFRRLDPNAWPAAHRSPRAFPRSFRLIVVATLAICSLLAAIVVGSKLLAPLPAPVPTNMITSAGRLAEPISAPIAIALTDGRVLVGGDGQRRAIAVVVDLATGDRTPLDTPFPSVSLEDVVRLPDGRLVLLGWEHNDLAFRGRSRLWIYDTATGSLGNASVTLEPRFDGSAVALPDGRVLIVGGVPDPESPDFVRSTEIFDPRSAALSAGPDIGSRRSGPVLMATATGKVLVVGGEDFMLQGGGTVDSAIELLDLQAGTSRVVGSLEGTEGRGRAHIVALPDGRILILGRQIGPQLCGQHEIDPISAQIFDPVAETLVPAPPVAHSVLLATSVGDGRVIVGGHWTAIPGGCQSGSDYVENSWLGIYDPAVGIVAETRNPIANTETLSIAVSHRYTAAALLADGRLVLVAEDAPLNGEPRNALDVLTLAPR